MSETLYTTNELIQVLESSYMRDVIGGSPYMRGYSAGMTDLARTLAFRLKNNTIRGVEIPKETHHHTLCCSGWPEEMDCEGVSENCSCLTGKASTSGLCARCRLEKL